MNYNYHTHTFRCRHATGKEEEYILRAVEGGIKYMGFSDHFPMKFPDGHESWYRVPTSQVKEYFETISELREKYKGLIDIRIGFEMEYYPEYFDQMLANAVDYGAEYLILGQHYMKPENLPEPCHTYNPIEDEDTLVRFADLLTEAMGKGVFTYVAHPDVIRFTGDLSHYQQQMRRICEASKRYTVPVEINFLGIREDRFYPKKEFWEIAGEVACPVTFGFDAHNATSAYDAESLEKAQEMVKKYNLNYIGKPKLIDIRKI